MSAKRWTLIAVVLGSATVFLDTTVVNVALPRIGEELPATVVGVLEGQSYVTNGYLLTLSALLILAGALGDVYGRRRVFTIGLVGFGVTSVLCGLAPSMELLIAFRLLQGAFGALLVPASLSIIRATFEGAEQGRAFGIWAAASAATTTLGPPLGGLLVDTVSWRVAFLINAPVAAVALYAAVRHVSETRERDRRARFDWLGAAVVALAVGGLSYGLIRGQEKVWADASAFVALAVGVAATVALPFVMGLRRDPLVPLSLFRSRNFTVTNASTFLIYGALYVSSAYQAIFVQGTVGYSAMAAGMLGLPIGIMLAFFSTPIGALAGRRGPRAFMAVGPLLMGIGLLWLARMPYDTTAWHASAGDVASLIPPVSYLVDFLPSILLFAFGIAILVAPLTTALMASVPVTHAGLASAINNAISRVGPLIAGAVIFVAITGAFYAGLAARVPGLDPNAADVRATIPPLNRPDPRVPAGQIAAARDASTDAFRLAMAVAAGLCLLGGAVNAVGIRNDQPTG
ncbi:MAG: MFS transporter [Chloroflexota bacterium]|nr:MFS transporter [Chloroflexota bacterium]